MKKHNTQYPPEKTTRRWKPSKDLRESISAMSAKGFPVEMIAELCGVSINTLQKKCERELKDGSADIHAKVASFIANCATGDSLNYGANYSECLKAALFWAKSKMNWAETTKLEGNLQLTPILNVTLNGNKSLAASEAGERPRIESN